ncbi:MAG: Trk system potassium transporter TrkA [Duncaniella sp.]|nr:Trk system potassium transporter TrkA [Duncaniella sp.]
MRIIIAGDGETGTHLANTLSVENQDIVLMGTDSEHLAELDAVSNFITFEGSPMSVTNLMQCGVDKADLFIAVTPDETVNLIACELAKDCGARKCVARVDNPEFDTERVRTMFRNRGVDMTIFPEKLAAAEIAGFIDHNWVSEWSRFNKGELFVVGVRMEAGGELCDKHLYEVPNTPRLFHVSAIKRGNEIIIPRGSDLLLEGDTIYFSVLPHNIDLLPALCGKNVTHVKRIMISGAGRVTEHLLELIEADYDITVIDPDKERCRTIASRFPKTVVINATANDVVTLKEEGIDSCNMFLALTGSSEKNIVSCMVAREHKVAKTLARIEELQYVPEAKSLSIDKIINKKLLNAGRILSLLLDTDADATQSFAFDNAEIACMTAPADSKIVSRPIYQLSLPRELTIGGVIRDGEGMLVEGRTQIQPGDNVVVFFIPGALGKVERLFR